MDQHPELSRLAGSRRSVKESGLGLSTQIGSVGCYSLCLSTQPSGLFEALGRSQPSQAALGGFSMVKRSVTLRHESVPFETGKHSKGNSKGGLLKMPPGRASTLGASNQLTSQGSSWHFSFTLQLRRCCLRLFKSTFLQPGAVLTCQV